MKKIAIFGILFSSILAIADSPQLKINKFHLYQIMNSRDLEMGRHFEYPRNIYSPVLTEWLKSKVFEIDEPEIKEIKKIISEWTKNKWVSELGDQARLSIDFEYNDSFKLIKSLSDCEKLFYDSVITELKTENISFKTRIEIESGKLPFLITNRFVNNKGQLRKIDIEALLYYDIASRKWVAIYRNANVTITDQELSFGGGGISSSGD